MLEDQETKVPTTGRFADWLREKPRAGALLTRFEMAEDAKFRTRLGLLTRATVRRIFRS